MYVFGREWYGAELPIKSEHHVAVLSRTRSGRNYLLVRTMYTYSCGPSARSRELDIGQVLTQSRAGSIAPSCSLGQPITARYLVHLGCSRSLPCKYIYYIDTDEIPEFLLLLKNHIFTARSEDTIFIFHV